MQINVFKDGFEDRIEREATKIQTFEQLQSFIDSRASLIRITAPIPLRVSNPKLELSGLFARVYLSRSLAAKMLGRTSPRNIFKRSSRNDYATLG
jgi:hypothetical protein